MARQPKLYTSEQLKSKGKNSRNVKALPNCDYTGFIPINLQITIPMTFPFSCEKYQN